jgi:hypothetical protein
MAAVTTLPAAFVSGDILTATQMNNLRGAFRVLQVVSMETSTTVSNSTTTFAASGLTLSITPSSTSSKILVMSNSAIAKTSGNANNGVNLRLRRGATVLQNQVACLFTGTAIVNIGNATMMTLDSPNTTSATTYDVQFANFTAAVSADHNANSSTSSLVLMEISA